MPTKYGFIIARPKETTGILSPGMMVTLAAYKGIHPQEMGGIELDKDDAIFLRGVQLATSGTNLAIESGAVIASIKKLGRIEIVVEVTDA